jgi:hypothetical protein
MQHLYKFSSVSGIMVFLTQADLFTLAYYIPFSPFKLFAYIFAPIWLHNCLASFHLASFFRCHDEIMSGILSFKAKFCLV